MSIPKIISLLNKRKSYSTVGRIKENSRDGKLEEGKNEKLNCLQKKMNIVCMQAWNKWQRRDWRPREIEYLEPNTCNNKREYNAYVESSLIYRQNQTQTTNDH